MKNSTKRELLVGLFLIQNDLRYNLTGPRERYPRWVSWKPLARQMETRCFNSASDADPREPHAEVDSILLITSGFSRSHKIPQLIDFCLILLDWW